VHIERQGDLTQECREISKFPRKHEFPAQCQKVTLELGKSP